MQSEQAPTLSLTPGQLKRIKIFADFTEEQLTGFVSLVEPVQVRPNLLIVKRQDRGDCMYLVLAGEVRVSDTVDGRETILAKLETGDFFGEICLFDEGPRSADVVAVRDCTLLRITKQAFEDIIAHHPAIGAQFLRAILRVVVERMRSMDKKYVDTMQLSRFWQRGPR